MALLADRDGRSLLEEGRVRVSRGRVACMAIDATGGVGRVRRPPLRQENVKVIVEGLVVENRTVALHAISVAERCILYRGLRIVPRKI
jgi:hypothetical protein